MKLASISENHNIERRIAITPDIAKKYISLDDYSTGTKKNHIKHKNIKYLYGSTKNIKKKLSKYKSSIHSIFHLRL